MFKISNRYVRTQRHLEENTLQNTKTKREYRKEQLDFITRKCINAIITEGWKLNMDGIPIITEEISRRRGPTISEQYKDELSKEL